MLSAQTVRRQVRLNEVQVVAQRRLKDAGIEKTQLDTAILHENISQSMADVLSKNTTLFIKSYGRATESTAEFRGTSPSHTQVMWNGMRINSPMLGTMDFSTIPGYFIDEANLYHGASSLNITGGGLGGAVEMLSRNNLRQGLHLQYVQGIGSYKTFDQFLRATYRCGRWASSTRVAYSTSKNDFTSTNYDKMVDVLDASGKVVSSYHPQETNKSGYFDDVHLLQEVYYDASDKDKLSLAAWYSYSKRGLPFLSVDYKSDADFTNESQAKTLRSVLSWNHYDGSWNLDVKGGYAYQDQAYDYYTIHETRRTDITNSQSYTNTAFLKGDFDWEFSKHWLLTVGSSVYYNHVRSADRSPYHYGDNFSRGRVDADVNAQIRWRPLELLTISAIVREEQHGTTTSAPIPALFADFIVYKPWNIVLKASVARNYRFPSMDDLFFQPGGNPDLNPEKGVTYDGGVEWAVKRKAWLFKGNVTAYNSYIDDWILWTPNAKGYWEPSNVKRVHSYGIEASAQCDVLLARELKLSLSGNFAWTPSKNEGDNLGETSTESAATDQSYGKQLCYVPERSANLNGKLQWKSWTLGYQWQYYSERYTTTSNEVGYITGILMPYYNSDLSLEKEFQIKRVSFSAKGVVRNLLNSEYNTVLSRPLPGRNFEVYLTVKL